jgi:ubiquinone/menaquinone biosynthesis C-methylase UbiE
MTRPLLQREQYGKGGIGRWYWDFRDRRTLSYIGDEKNIMDVGCGEGITLQKLLREFPDRNVVGIDYSPEKVSTCEQHQLPARQGNACGLEFADQSMDCCLFLEVVEHLLDPLNALHEIHRVLRVGGLLLLIFPNDFIFKVARLGCGKFKEAFTPSGHVRQWTPAEMRRTLEGVGFGIQEVACLPFYFWRCSLHCLMVARRK